MTQEPEPAAARHTTEPWQALQRVEGRDDWIVASHPETEPPIPVARIGGRDASEHEPNARRIVACVNALESVPAAALEDGIIEEMVDALEVAAKQREVPGLQHLASTLLAKLDGGGE